MTNYQSVVDMMLRMRREMGGEENTNPPEIHQLILIDRDVDLITPLPTQLTYEGKSLISGFKLSGRSHRRVFRDQKQSVVCLL